MDSFIWRNHSLPRIALGTVQMGLPYGIGNITGPPDANLACDLPEIDLIQVPFNVFDQRGWRLKWFDRALGSGKLILVRSIYLQGLLLVDKLSPRMEFAGRAKEQLHSLCRQYRLSPAGLSTAYVARKSRQAVLLFGAESPRPR